MNAATARVLLGAFLPGAVAAGGLVPYVLYRSELPDRVASHFNASSTPDGSMTPSQFAIVTSAICLNNRFECLEPLDDPGAISTEVLSMCPGYVTRSLNNITNSEFACPHGLFQQF